MVATYIFIIVLESFTLTRTLQLLAIILLYITQFKTWVVLKHLVARLLLKTLWQKILWQIVQQLNNGIVAFNRACIPLKYFVKLCLFILICSVILYKSIATGSYLK